MKRRGAKSIRFFRHVSQPYGPGVTPTNWYRMPTWSKAAISLSRPERPRDIIVVAALRRTASGKPVLSCRVNDGGRPHSR